MYRNAPYRLFKAAVVCVWFAAPLLLGTAAPRICHAEVTPRDSFLAIQRQVESIEARMVQTTVLIQLSDGSGSGVIVSPDGLILTAGHVLEGRPGRRVRIGLADGRSFTATVLGWDNDSDLGLAKIDEAVDLPFARLGDSSTLRRSQWILATGHPLGQHVGRPPVLRIGRILTVMNGKTPHDVNTITTDAPIISGDSGGPLFDLNGRVVGINSMVTSGGQRPMSLHSPINLGKGAIADALQGNTPQWTGPQYGFTRRINSAQAALNAGDGETALNYARQAEETDPDSAAARILEARAAAKIGQTDVAFVALSAAIDRGYNDLESLRKDADLGSYTRLPKFAPLLARLEAINGLPGENKGDRLLLSADLAPKPSGGIVRVQSNGSTIALGAVMSTDGDVLTKASELPEGMLVCLLPDGRKVVAQRKGVDPAWDVALLRIDAVGLKPLPLADTARVGEWTYSPGIDGAPQAIGVVGVSDMPVANKGIAGKGTSKAYMGVQMGPADEDALRMANLTHGIAVRVQRDQPAARAGVFSGDIIYEIDDQPVHDADSVMDYLLKKHPGDSVTLKIVRERERHTIVVPLTTRPAGLMGRGGLAEFLSGDISHMQGPFTRVMHHDTALSPSAMGGPVLDSEGRCIGLNIARADRTSTYAIEVRDIKEIYAKLKRQ